YGMRTLNNLQDGLQCWIPPEVTKSVRLGKELLVEGMDVTVMFVDLQNFTKTAEDFDISFFLYEIELPTTTLFEIILTTSIELPISRTTIDMETIMINLILQI
ncbi:unnamed protein product, partial [marine sediment metagenome]